MKYRTKCAAVLLALTCVLVACGNEEAQKPEKEKTTNLQMVEEASNLEDATIVISEGFLGNELDQFTGVVSEETGVLPETEETETNTSGDAMEASQTGDSTQISGTQTQVTTDDRGNVTVDFNGEDRTAVVNAVAQDLEASIASVLANDSVYPNLTDIKVNADCTEFTIYLNTNTPNPYESMLMMSFYVMGNKYQLYNGVPENEVLTTVVYVNSATGAELARTSSNTMQY